MNLEGYAAGSGRGQRVGGRGSLAASRLATVTGEVTAALEGYHYADAARVLYDFAWNEFCSFYVEMVKSRLQDPAARPVAQRMLAHTLDVLLRLLHPMVPFITEEVWQLLGSGGAERGLERPEPAAAEHDDRALAGGRYGPARRRDRSPLCTVPAGAGRPARDSQPAKHSAQDAAASSPGVAMPARRRCCGRWSPILSRWPMPRPAAGGRRQSAGHVERIPRWRGRGVGRSGGPGRWRRRSPARRRS